MTFRCRTRSRRSRALSERWAGYDPGEMEFEPRLDDLLRELSVSQRTIVVLVHGYGWTHREVADLLRLGDADGSGRRGRGNGVLCVVQRRKDNGWSKEGHDGGAE